MHGFHRFPSRPQVHLLHLPVRPHLVRIALDEHLAVRHRRDALGETEHAIDVVLDDEHAHVLRERADHRNDALALRRRQSRERLVEEQQLRAGGQRHADLHQALAAVREARDRRRFHALQSEEADELLRLEVDDRVLLGIAAEEEFPAVRRPEGCPVRLAHAAAPRAVGLHDPHAGPGLLRPGFERERDPPIVRREGRAMARPEIDAPREAVMGHD